MFNSVQHIDFFSDNGPPFYSNDWIHTAVTKLALKDTIVSTATMAISFFAPGEGKNLCDGHFGVLSRKMSIWIQMAISWNEILSHSSLCLNAT